MRNHVPQRAAYLGAAVVVTVCIGCSDPCRSKCELAGPECPEQDVDEFPGLEAARADLTARVAQWNCEGGFPFAAAGECPDGRLFLYEGGGFVSKATFYHADTGDFIGLTTQTDVIDIVCRGRGYWPSPIECAGAMVTKVFCGTSVTVGDEVRLP